MPKINNAAYLSNNHISISFEPKEVSCFNRVKITMRDHEDQYNLPVLYTTKVRHVEDAWREIESTFTDSMAWYDVTRILNAHEVGYHSYCAMD